MPKIGLTFDEIDSLIGRDFRAWTGGSAPRPITQVSREERRAISILFRDHCSIFWHSWRDLPHSVKRIFWNRARHDAHATFRNGPRG